MVDKAIRAALAAFAPQVTGVSWPAAGAASPAAAMAGPLTSWPTPLSTAGRSP